MILYALEKDRSVLSHDQSSDSSEKDLLARHLIVPSAFLASSSIAVSSITSRTRVGRLHLFLVPNGPETVLYRRYMSPRHIRKARQIAKWLFLFRRHLFATLHSW